MTVRDRSARTAWTPPPVMLVHGAATTATVWDGVRRHLDGLTVLVPQRRYTGDLREECGSLADSASGALIVGVSGGATLGLALLSAGVPVAGAVLHEPAVGSLVPGLLDGVVRGYQDAGVTGFGRALYGPAWRPEMAPGDADAVARDLAMFRAFEPQPIPPLSGPVLVTVGALSPPPRHAASRALDRRFGLTPRVLAGCGHAVHLDRPDVLAAVVWEVIHGMAASPSR